MPGHPFEALVGGPHPSTVLEHLTQPEQLPGWLTTDDRGWYVSEFERTGFCGGLSWYRSINRTWELTAAFRGVPIR
jgi:hypothetical protein